MCSEHGAPTVRTCPRCTSITRSLIEIVGYGVARSRDQLKLAAELVLRYAADYAAHLRKQKRRSTDALDLAALFYVTAVPL